MPIPSAISTSNLTFSDLLIETSRAFGVAYYGANGDEAAQVPVDVHDLAECKRHVNNAIRQIFSDAPEAGWRWTRITYDLTLWADVVQPVGRTFTFGSYAAATDTTPVTANAATFFESMVGKTLTLADATEVIIESYVSSTVVNVQGDQSAVATQNGSILSGGAFTLPTFFAGMVDGNITFARNERDGYFIEWSDEAAVRSWWESTNDDRGDPYIAALRRALLPTADPRARWELITYPAPYQDTVVSFPFTIYSDELDALTDRVSWPIYMDAVVKSACLATVEQDVMQNTGPATQRYERDLAAAYRLDGRTAPRKLGYFGNLDMPFSISRASRNWRAGVYDRPNVSFNG